MRLICFIVVAALVVSGCSSTGRGSPPQASGAGLNTPPSSVGSASTSRAAASSRTTSSSTVAISLRYAFPVAGCSTSYGHSHHDYPATDIFTRRGCAFVAPIAGVVDEVTRVDRWNPSTNRGADRGGISVSMIGLDGVRYYGSHLASVAAGIVPRARVKAGQLLGRIDNSGNAAGTATHVHFGISWPTRPGVWWIRRGVLYPWPYLDSWRAGGNRSPVSAVKALRKRAGSATPPCRVGC
jgi:hypothetical protein